MIETTDVCEEVDCRIKMAFNSVDDVRLENVITDKLSNVRVLSL